PEIQETYRERPCTPAFDPNRPCGTLTAWRHGASMSCWSPRPLTVSLETGIGQIEDPTNWGNSLVRQRFLAPLGRMQYLYEVRRRKQVELSITREVGAQPTI